MPQRSSRDDRDALKDMVRDLAELVGEMESLQGDAFAYLRDRNYSRLRLRLEMAHAALEAALVEARRRHRIRESE